MKKLFISTLFAFTFALASCNTSKPNNSAINSTYDVEQKTELISNIDSYIDSLMADTPSYVPVWSKEGFKGVWNYIDGVFLNSIVNTYYLTNDNKYMDFVVKFVNYYIDEDGYFVSYVKDNKGNYINPNTNQLAQKGDNSGFKLSERLDVVCESKILFDLYDYTKDDRYLKAINYTYDRLIEHDRVSGTVNFYHKQRYTEQIWLDGFYMYVPFYSRYAKYNNKAEIFDEIKSQYEFVYNHMRDEKTGLYYHAYDNREPSKKEAWADPDTGCSHEIWARGLGWFVMSLTDSLEYFPEGSNKIYLTNILKDVIESIYKYQDKETKMFFQLVDKPNKEIFVPYYYFQKTKNTNYTSDSTVKNYVEASGTSMFAYSMMKSARLGYIDSKYLNYGIQTFEGLCNHSFDSKTNELKDICIVGGLGPMASSPHRDGTEAYYMAEPVGSNEAKGVGPFLMAYLEYRR